MAGWYTKAVEEVCNGTIDLDTNTLKVLLVTASYTYNADDLVVDAGGANDVVDHEINVTGYTPGWGGAGRKTAVITMQSSTANNRVEIAIGDLTWTALATGATITAAILVKEGGANDTTSRLIAYFDVTSTPTNGGDFTLDFLTLGAFGNLRIAV